MVFEVRLRGAIQRISLNDIPQNGFVPGAVVLATLLFLTDPTCWWSCTLASLGEKYQYLKFQSVWISKLINYPADNVLFILSNIREYSLPPSQYVIMKI